MKVGNVKDKVYPENISTISQTKKNNFLIQLSEEFENNKIILNSLYD